MDFSRSRKALQYLRLDAAVPLGISSGKCKGSTPRGATLPECLAGEPASQIRPCLTTTRDGTMCKDYPVRRETAPRRLCCISTCGYRSRIVLLARTWLGKAKIQSGPCPAPQRVRVAAKRSFSKILRNEKIEAREACLARLAAGCDCSANSGGTSALHLVPWNCLGKQQKSGACLFRARLTEVHQARLNRVLPRPPP